ncbi:MAG: hypothetical protein WB715_09255, partial [Roseiarcus sp.]
AESPAGYWFPGFERIPFQSVWVGLALIHIRPARNIIVGAGYLRELHDRYLVPRFLSAYDGVRVRRGPPRTA